MQTGGSDRSTFEQLVRTSAWRATTVDAVRAELQRQIAYQPRPDSDGLDELAELLARRFDDGGAQLGAESETLARRFPRQPTVQLYTFALAREAGDREAARASLAALLEADPGDPMAAYFDGAMRSETVISASEEERLANIAKFAATPLLKNPYSLAIGLLFDSIHDHEHARVLDIGVGSGAQMEGLLELLGRLPHRLRRLEIVGLDFMPEFLDKAGARIAAAAEKLALDVHYEPHQGRVEALGESDCRAIAGDGLGAANATIALHEVAGEAKLAALSNLRRIAPARLVIAEWNYCLENTLPETSAEFVFNVRRVAGAMAASLRERHGIEASRAAVRDWLSQGTGQLTCAADRRQECFLDIASWKALLEHSGFTVSTADRHWLAYAAEPGHAAVADDGWYLRTSDYDGASPIALVAASPSG